MGEGVGFWGGCDYSTCSSFFLGYFGGLMFSLGWPFGPYFFKVKVTTLPVFYVVTAVVFVAIYPGCFSYDARFGGTVPLVVNDCRFVLPLFWVFL